jgi:hypothetical protein
MHVVSRNPFPKVLVIVARGVSHMLSKVLELYVTLPNKIYYYI